MISRRPLDRDIFAVVKLARHVFTGEKVAVKVIDKTKLDEVSKAHLFQEVRYVLADCASQCRWASIESNDLIALHSSADDVIALQKLFPQLTCNLN